MAFFFNPLAARDSCKIIFLEKGFILFSLFFFLFNQIFSLSVSAFMCRVKILGCVYIFFALTLLTRLLKYVSGKDEP